MSECGTNLEGYLRGELILAFEATWNAMTESFQTTELEEAKISRPRHLIFIRITKAPFWIWFSLVMLAVISGALFMAVEHYAEKRLSVPSDLQDPFLAALRLDMSELYNPIPGICRSSGLSKEEPKTWLKLSRDEMEAGHEHEGMTGWCRLRKVRKVDANEGHGTEGTELTGQ